MLIIGLAYTVMSLVTFCCYGFDKHRARSGGWRIKESTLHGLELLGGWPGALLGQMVFRHRLRKLSFMLVFALIVALHLGLWVAFLYRLA